MTLQSSGADYLGFIRADKTVVDNCTIMVKHFTGVIHQLILSIQHLIALQAIMQSGHIVHQ